MKTVYDGVEYHSKAEATYALQLDLRVKAGDVVHWQRQIRFPLSVNGVLITTYVMDFVVYHPNGLIELVEVKGYETAVYKLKAKLLKALYIDDNPKMAYTVVKS